MVVKKQNTLRQILNCSCGNFEPTLGLTYKCVHCGTIINCFNNLKEFNQLPPFVTENMSNPTDIKLVWGTFEQITPSFYKRVKIVEEIIKGIPDETSVGADISGGAGRWLPHLSIYFDSFIHMDISREALNIANSTNPNLNNVLYVQNDLYSHRQAIKNVDIAFCLDTLLYSGNFVDRALVGISDILKSGGILIADFPSRYHNNIANLIKLRHPDGVNRRFGVQEVRDLFYSNGFSIEKEVFFFQELPSKLNAMMSRFSFADLVNNLSTWFYFLARRL